MVEVREDGTLMWADNLAAKASSSRRFGGGNSVGVTRSMREELDELRSSLVRVCADEGQLKKFWDDCVDRLRVEAASVVSDGCVGNGIVGSSTGAGD
ncbi:hypothetical protein CROQUDRAFT_654296 [Cronartium quercuum f. sp. fusiforme G11]|uniref:Uncharacterized protein n=1 Tax=Cronartium quercuum f. sp. fusiforme G11 TaxID=708437 RepID=A0A9P6NSW3_9BASI|nr:hypothetical protein CROQUDRAFT_654296 [Cronartium quercuum f. sp. fusiforme G11]